MNTQPTVGRRIIRASIAVAIAHIVFKFAALIQAMAMGRALPKETYDVVYGFAFEKCIFVLFLIGDQVLRPALMPVFTRELGTASESGADGAINTDGTAERDSAAQLVRTVLRLQGLVLILVVALLVGAPHLAVRLLTRWTPEHNPEIFAQAVTSVRWLAPALLGLSLGSTTYVLLNAHKRFFIAAFADAVWKLCVAGLLIFAFATKAPNVRQYLVVGLLLGSILKFGTHLFGLRDQKGLLFGKASYRHPALRDLALLMLPLIVGVLFSQWRDVFNDVTVLSRLDEAGLIQANSLGRKLQSSIGMLVPYTLSIAMFPFFCDLVDQRDHRRLGELLTQSCRMLIVLLLPLAAVVAVVSMPMTALLFKGGHFDQQSVILTSVSTACYTFVLPAMAVEMLLMQAFFANRRMTSVTAAGILFSLFSMGISYWAVVWRGWQGSAALAMVAGGFTLARWLKSLTLVGLLRRTVPLFPARETAGFMLRVLLLSALVGAGAWCGLKAATLIGLGGDARLALIAQLAAASAGAALMFVAGCGLCHIREPREMINWALARRKQARCKQAR